jgi:hypothetical protein
MATAQKLLGMEYYGRTDGFSTGVFGVSSKIGVEGRILGDEDSQGVGELALADLPVAGSMGRRSVGPG